MSRIVYIGMDVHSQIFSLCAFEPGGDSQDKYFADTKVLAEPINIKNVCSKATTSIGNNRRFVTGYEDDASVSAFIMLLQVRI